MRAARDAQATATPLHPTAAIDAPDAALSLQSDAVTATPASWTRRPDAARFLRIRAGIEAGRIKPSIRAIYAAEGASQTVAI